MHIHNGAYVQLGMDIHNPIIIVDDRIMDMKISNMDVHNSVTDNTIMDIHNSVMDIYN